jgi:hypothetical protein
LDYVFLSSFERFWNLHALDQVKTVPIIRFGVPDQIARPVDLPPSKVFFRVQFSVVARFYRKVLVPKILNRIVMSVAGNILQRSLEKGENLKHCHTV